MLGDGSLNVYGYKAVDLGLKKLNNKNDFCLLKQNTPEVALATLLKARKNAEPPLQEVILEMERLFEENQQTLVPKKPKPPVLVEKTKTAPKKRKAKAKSKASGP